MLSYFRVFCQSPLKRNKTSIKRAYDSTSEVRCVYPAFSGVFINHDPFNQLLTSLNKQRRQRRQRSFFLYEWTE